MPPALILFAHGSRDPLWRLPIDAVAAEIARQSPEQTVCCAFLELCSPDLDTAVQQLMHQGHRHVRIVPMFLGMGRHAREDLPAIVARLQTELPQLQLELSRPVGEDPDLTRCLARIALGTQQPNEPSQSSGR